MLKRPRLLFRSKQTPRHLSFSSEPKHAFGDTITPQKY